MIDLQALGWDARWEEAFAPFRGRGLQPARVALEDKHAYVTVAAEGEVPARVAGRLLRDRSATAGLPKVGDWVAISRKPGDSRAMIHAVLPRRTCLTRKIPGREVVPQVLAANVDVAFIVQAFDGSFNLRRLERFLVMVHEGGAQAVVVLNKADLASDLEARLREAQVAAGSAPVLAVSARTGSNVDALRRFLGPGRTCVFVGTSGVGKSSLINCLYGEELQATMDVRERDSKGRHTTTWRELIPLPDGGLVIDTPGMRELHMWVADGGLEEAFPDIAEIALQCHYRACTHTSENRCAVKAAVAAGTLSAERFNSFIKLQRELQRLEKERREHAYMLRRRGSAIRRQAYDEDLDL